MFLPQFKKKKGQKIYFNDLMSVGSSHFEMPAGFLATCIPVVRQVTAVFTQKVRVFNHPENPSKRNNF